MKKILPLFFLLPLLLTSCFKDKCTETRSYTLYEPVWIQKSEYRNTAPAWEAARELRNPGQLYLYGSYLLINEIREGIHVIDNSDPSAPQRLGFIAIPGNVDLAIRNNVLYADSYTDLLSVDIASVGQPVLLERKEDVFPLNGSDSQNGVLAYYRETGITQEFDCSVSGSGTWFTDNRGLWAENTTFADLTNASGNGSAPSGTGVGGSMARFTIASDYLYCIDLMNLHTYGFQPDGRLQDHGDLQLPWGIETVYPFKDQLFVGANNGLHIVDISSPASPRYLSTFSHATACDPVVVQGNTAYVTLRSGTRCQGFNNQLDLVDVSDLQQPSLVKTYPMTNPHGLAVQGDYLYLCEGNSGLKVFKVNDPLRIDQNMVSHVKGFHSWDVIALPSSLVMVIGKDGFRQYDMQNPQAPALLSLIKVTRDK